MEHIFEHALIDSLKVFALVFILYFLLSFIEKHINKKLSSNSKVSPLYGALIGLIPQCGVSVAASDLYIKRKITLGTLIAVFLACSDEALFILLASNKALSVIPLLISKLILGFLIGYLIDNVFYKKQKLDKKEEVKVECCHHDHSHSDSKVLKNLRHIFLHSLEVFIYVFIVNILFGLLIYFIGENRIILFIENNKYLAPLIGVIVGLIPNCSSSIILCELYILNGIGFGTLLAGLSMNAGVGLIYLFKDNKNIKNNLLITLLLFAISLIIGYLTCVIIGF